MSHLNFGHHKIGAMFSPLVKNMSPCGPSIQISDPFMPARNAQFTDDCAGASEIVQGLLIHFRTAKT